MSDMKAIKMLQRAKKTHVEWAEFLEKYPDAESYKQYRHIGSAKQHRQYIEEYDEVIKQHKQLQAENEKLKQIADFTLDIHTRDPINTKNKWGVCGAAAEEKLVGMIENLKGK